jgi:very-short-patch-repair endonuclease
MPDETCIEPRIGVGCRSGDDGAAGAKGPDWVIAELAERQHGVVARRQLLDAGLCPRTIGLRLERGSLHGIHLGVYSVGHSVLGKNGRWMAAVLACGPGAVLSHRSAAMAWGLLRISGLPEVTRPGKFRPRRGIVARFASVPSDERGVVDGIPLTSVPRTILDLAVLGNRTHVRRALHEAEVQRLDDALSVADLLQRYPRRPGTRLLRELLGSDLVAEGVTVNDFEELFEALVEKHDLPRPRFNADLAVAGRILRPDCLWPDHGLIVELDGRATHETRRAFESDRKRDRTLLAAGWRVMRVTWRQLQDGPDTVAADLRSALHVTRPASSPV